MPKEVYAQFGHVLGAYQWIVDSDGINQFHHGHPEKSILWGELERFQGKRLISVHNLKIEFFKGSKGPRELKKIILREWSRRFPEKAAASQRRNETDFKKAVFVYYPAFTLLVLAALWALLLCMEFIPAFAAIRNQPDIIKIRHDAFICTILSLVGLPIFWVFVIWLHRKEDA
ncbi:MAG TPA: hypothetical protein VIH42_14995 [Thermoguttaceae bacterium]